MILHCNFEELGALKEGATALLGGTAGGDAPVAAPPEGSEEIESLIHGLTHRLSGDLAIDTLAEQRDVAKAVNSIVGHLKEEMDLSIITMHPADESAVASYFSYAHALAVMNRLVDMGQEMEALIEVVTGVAPTEETARTFRFPS